MKPFRQSYWRDPSFVVDDPVIKATGHGKGRDFHFIWSASKFHMSHLVHSRSVDPRIKAYSVKKFPKTTLFKEHWETVSP